MMLWLSGIPSSLARIDFLFVNRRSRAEWCDGRLGCWRSTAPVQYYAYTVSICTLHSAIRAFACLPRRDTEGETLFQVMICRLGEILFWDFSRKAPHVFSRGRSHIFDLTHPIGDCSSEQNRLQVESNVHDLCLLHSMARTEPLSAEHSTGFNLDNHLWAERVVGRQLWPTMRYTDVPQVPIVIILLTSSRKWEEWSPWCHSMKKNISRIVVDSLSLFLWWSQHLYKWKMEMKIGRFQNE